MPYYWISELNNLRIEDRPWGYMPGRGLPVTFQISYRQRGSFEQDNKVFGLGANWSCSLRAFVCVKTNNQGVVGIRQHHGGAGLVAYQMNVPEYRSRSYPTLLWDQFNCETKVLIKRVTHLVFGYAGR